MNKTLRRILWALDIILIIAETVVAALFTAPAVSGLDAIGMACKVKDGAPFMMSAPAMSILGLICRLFNARPMMVALNVLPFVMIPLCFAAYAFAAISLDGEEERISPALMLIIILLQLWGYQSEAFIPFTLLLSWYRGEAILVHLVLPILLALLIRWIKKKPEKEDGVAKDIGSDSNNEDEDDEMKHKYLNVRNLSIAILILAVLSIGAIVLLNRKINNLYEATVNLQNAVEDKGDFAEYIGADEAIKGYVLRSAEGTITVIDGGGYEEGSGMLELITKYGTAVDTWYLLGDESGALDYCVEQGLEVKKTYRVDGIEEIE